MLGHAGGVLSDLITQDPLWLPTVIFRSKNIHRRAPFCIDLYKRDGIRHSVTDQLGVT